jgi:S-DNA-T family DNA segregation ATPase FtsK/SpoIIIE
MRNKNSYRIVTGAKRIGRNKPLILIPVIYIISVGIMSYIGKGFLLALDQPFSSDLFGWVFLFFMAEIAIIGLMLILTVLGTPISSKKIENELSEIEFTDKKGNPPTLISKTREKNGWIYEFYSPRLPLYQYESHSEDIENAIDIKILSIEFGKNMQHVIIKAIDFARKPQETIMWRDSCLSSGDFILKLGESYFGDESFDLAVTPHVLIGGGSGSGKSKLLKLILMQCIKKGAMIYLADFKGGVDYPKIWHDKCSIIIEAEKLSDQLSDILAIMEERRKLFVESVVSNIREYNSKVELNLQRIIVACDEIAEVLDKAGLGKNDKDEKDLINKIESKLSTIARQGRAFGIHLILATQRPDADVLKGQIKNNIGMRICGRADKVLSQIILDNSDGAEKISQKDQGMFLTNTNVLFKAYYVEDNCLKGGISDVRKTTDQG